MDKRFGTFPIPDSREGWIMAVRLMEEQATDPELNVQLDTRKIKPAGKPVRWEGIVGIHESSKLPRF